MDYWLEESWIVVYVGNVDYWVEETWIVVYVGNVDCVEQTIIIGP